MSTVAAALMTTEEFLALPDDEGIERDLIRGELREWPMTRRNRKHSRSTIRIGHLLEQWLERQPEPRGEVVAGEGGFRLLRDPDTTAGIDVAYVAPQVAANQPDDRFFEGTPVLAVEILSPSDSQKRINEKLQIYQEAGVPLVWLADPVHKTVLVHRLGEEPVLFNVSQEISAEPYLPGFQVPVAKLFRI